jgi:hypothetical protein
MGARWWQAGGLRVAGGRPGGEPCKGRQSRRSGPENSRKEAAQPARFAFSLGVVWWYIYVFRPQVNNDLIVKVEHHATARAVGWF